MKARNWPPRQFENYGDGLEDLHAQGQAEGRSLRTAVFGDVMCILCRRHLPHAAEKAKLKEWMIYEQATGKTFYWKSGDTAFTELNGE